MENDVARYQGQLLFDDVTRAAGLMGQLAAYGEEQRNAPEVVDVTKVLRDLAPVLKRVAGEQHRCRAAESHGSSHAGR